MRSDSDITRTSKVFLFPSHNTLNTRLRPRESPGKRRHSNTLELGWQTVGRQCAIRNGTRQRIRNLEVTTIGEG